MICLSPPPAATLLAALGAAAARATRCQCALVTPAATLLLNNRLLPLASEHRHKLHTMHMKAGEALRQQHTNPHGRTHDRCE